MRLYDVFRIVELSTLLRVICRRLVVYEIANDVCGGRLPIVTWLRGKIFFRLDSCFRNIPLFHHTAGNKLHLKIALKTFNLFFSDS